MRVLKLVAALIILGAVGIPFLPAPRNATAYAQHFRELSELKGSETMVVLCKVSYSGIDMCDLVPNEKAKHLMMPACDAKRFDAVMGGLCRLDDGYQYATPTAEQRSNIAFMAKAEAWKVQRQYYTAAAAVAAMGFLLLLVGMRSSRRLPQSDGQVAPQDPPAA